MLKDEILTIRGAEKIITGDADRSYRIESGRVYVFIVPFQGDEGGRRLFAAECRSGDVVPSLSTSMVLLEDDDMRDWRFVIVPMEETALHVIPLEKEHLIQFGRKMGIDASDPMCFESETVEKYRLGVVVDMRNLYATEKQSESADRNSFRIMLENLTQGRHRGISENTSSPVYDATAVICRNMRIDLLPFDVLRSACGGRIDIEEIARLSGFPIRRITLEENWFRSECGDLLVYYDNDKTPMAAIQKGSRRYELHDPKKGTTVKITAEVAAHILPSAVAIYRPLPARELDFKDILVFAKRMLRRKDMAFTIGLAIVGTFLGLLIPYMNERIYDVFIPQGDASGLTAICLVILSCMLGNVAFSMVGGIASFRNNTRMQYAIEVALYDRVFNMPDSTLREVETADMIQRILSVSQLFNTAVTVIESQGLGLVLSVIYLVKMYDYSPELSNAALVMAVLAVLAMVIISLSCYRLSEEKMRVDGSISSMLYQFLSGITKLRHAGAEDRALNEYIREYAFSTGITKSLRTRMNSAAIIGEGAKIIFSMVLFYIMIKNSLSITPGQFMGFNAAFTSFSSAVLALAGAVTTIGVMIPAINRAKVLLEGVPEVDVNLSMPGTLTGEIEVNHVSFRYDENSRNVLKNINLNIHRGEYIGIVGTSGCGKSTLLKLLLGFEKPTEGKIYYDGMDIDDMNKRQLRKEFGVVLQNGSLIPGSIYDNITIAAPDANAQQVMWAIESVGLKEDIDRMPMGLNTVLSEGTGQISGGQKQRILIARAIVNKPEVLFFDEATSALDNITQAQVAASLEKISATRIVIAHRLSTIMNCDRILVMDDGRIVEEGSFQELMEKGGLFAEFAGRQM